jgi:hypothetical protein
MKELFTCSAIYVTKFSDSVSFIIIGHVCVVVLDCLGFQNIA